MLNTQLDTGAEASHFPSGRNCKWALVLQCAASGRSEILCLYLYMDGWTRV